MRKSEIILGCGLAGWSVLVLADSNLNHIHSYAHLRGSSIGVIATDCGGVIGLCQALSAWQSWNFGRRWFALGSVCSWTALAVFISSITHGITPGAVACLTLAGVNMRTACGLPHDE